MWEGLVAHYRTKTEPKDLENKPKKDTKPASRGFPRKKLFGFCFFGVVSPPPPTHQTPRCGES